MSLWNEREREDKGEHENKWGKKIVQKIINKYTMWLMLFSITTQNLSLVKVDFYLFG